MSDESRRDRWSFGNFSPSRGYCDRSLTLTGGIIAGFWGAWFFIASLTDTINLLQVFEFLPKTLLLTSQNYEFLTKFTARYEFSSTLNLGIFITILLWSWAITISIFKSLLKSKLPYFALLAGIVMTMFFILADEFFIHYEVEHGHLLRLCAQMISLVIINFENMQRFCCEEHKK